MSVEPIIYPWVEPIWQHLSEERSRNTHAMMFIGPPGLGKAACALSYARHLVAGDGASTGHGEGLFNAGTHPDVHILIPEDRLLEDGGLVDKYAERYREKHTGKPRTVITIDQVRQLAGAITTFAHSAGVKAVLLFDAHLMNRNAANALLKSLEEPTSNTVFVLVTDKPERTPMTVRSRCTLVPFRPPAKEVALEWLRARTGDSDGCENWLSMAGGSPLIAYQMRETGYTDLQISVFKSVASLWNRQSSVSRVAGEWSGDDSDEVLRILQKLFADLARFSVSEQPSNLYYPAQAEWLQRTAKKIHLDRIMKTFDDAGLKGNLLNGPTDKTLLMVDMAAAVSRMVD